MARSRKRTVNSAQAVTTGSTIRFETPKSERKPKPSAVVMVAQEIHPVGGFVNFLREYAVVGLAVGFVIGLQAQVLVKQLVSSFITPLFTLIFGKDLASRQFHLSWHGRTEGFTWGAFAYSMLNFLFVLAAVYLVVRFFKLDKFDKPKKKKEA